MCARRGVGGQNGTQLLEKTLSVRPSAEELTAKHIMKSPIQDRAETLAHAKAANALEKGLSKRLSVQVRACCAGE